MDLAGYNSDLIFGLGLKAKHFKFMLMLWIWRVDNQSVCSAEDHSINPSRSQNWYTGEKPNYKVAYHSRNMYANPSKPALVAYWFPGRVEGVHTGIQSPEWLGHDYSCFQYLIYVCVEIRVYIKV